MQGKILEDKLAALSLCVCFLPIGTFTFLLSFSYLRHYLLTHFQNVISTLFLRLSIPPLLLPALSVASLLHNQLAFIPRLNHRKLLSLAPLPRKLLRYTVPIPHTAASTHSDP